jgi:uncharacterized SAM-binding protein YcdF (DUF218 family)
MFFIFSKLLAFALKPLNILIILALAGWWMRSPKWQKRLRIVLFITALGFTNPWIIQQLARAWETGQRDPDTIQTPYEVGIVLGGFSNLRAVGPNGLLSMHRAGNRLTAALQLYHTGKIKHILITGGAGQIWSHTPPEAPVAARFLRQCGVPDSAIWIEDRSRNTIENALFTQQLLTSRGVSQHNSLLITSAWHMRRAEAVFQKAGVRCDAFGTDFFSERHDGNFLRWIEPDWQALMQWEVLLKEWVGFWVYKCKGVA